MLKAVYNNQIRGLLYSRTFLKLTLLLVLLFTGFLAYGQHVQGIFRVHKIHEDEQYYLILLRKDNLRYTIYSEKGIALRGEKIQADSLYNFELTIIKDTLSAINYLDYRRFPQFSNEEIGVMCCAKNLVGITIQPKQNTCQLSVSGRVTDKYGKFPLIGVSIIEKGTQNGIVTDTMGFFRINISAPNSILTFFYVGYEITEIAIAKEDSIAVRLQPQCFRDWFDHQRIGFSYCGGMLNTPFGGELEFSYPAFFKQLVVKNRINFQTNGHGNHLMNASASLEHLAVSCNFDADILFNYRRIYQIRSFSLNSYSVESSLNFSRNFLGYYRLIFGYSLIETDTDSKWKYSPVVGLGVPIGRPLNIMITGKVSISNTIHEIQGDITRRFKKVNTFLRFYNYKTFSELSAGIGLDFAYRFKSQK